MTVQAKLCSVTLAVVYALSAFVPAMHVLFHAEDHDCTVCVAPDDGPSISSYCDQPCGDPDHHHHPQHNDHKCPTCQWNKTLHTALAFFHFQLTTVHTSFTSHTHRQKLLRTTDFTVAVPRAPPLASTL